MRKKRYSGVDVHNWQVVDFNGKVIPFHTTVLNEDGKPVKVIIYRFNGFRTANRAVKKMGKGVAVRA